MNSEDWSARLTKQKNIPVNERRGWTEEFLQSVPILKDIL